MNHLAECLAEQLVQEWESRLEQCLVKGSGVSLGERSAKGLVASSGRSMVSPLGGCLGGCWAILMGSLWANHSGTHLVALSGSRLATGSADYWVAPTESLSGFD